jgi:hypothetical protein
MDKVLRLNRTISASFTRPADTTAYAVGDVVADSTGTPHVMTFPNVAKDPNGCAVINEALCIDGACAGTKPDLELWLFDVAPAAENDNAVFAPSAAEIANLVAVIPFPVASFKAGNPNVGANASCVCDQQNLGYPVNTKGGGNTLYGILVVRNVYTPVSGESFTIKLKVLD